MSEQKITTTTISVEGIGWQIEARLLKELMKMQMKIGFREHSEPRFHFYIYNKSPFIVVKGDYVQIVGKAKAKPVEKAPDIHFATPISELKEMLKEFNIRRTNSQKPIEILPNIQEKNIEFVFVDKWDNIYTIPAEIAYEKPDLRILKNNYRVSFEIEAANIVKTLKELKSFQNCRIEVSNENGKPTLTLYQISDVTELYDTDKLKITPNQGQANIEYLDNKPKKVVATLINSDHLINMLKLLQVKTCKIQIGLNGLVKLFAETNFAEWVIVLAPKINEIGPFY